ncbi:MULTISPECIES: FecR family protein [unclassified Carboxylicivirga]|uniref:FecR family protein n=1 Tax=Carboxylicivirga TaxID=1628153 RepID=UPI003D358F69
MKKKNFNHGLLVKYLFRQTGAAEEAEVGEWLSRASARYRYLDKLLKAKSLMQAEEESSWMKEDLKAIQQRIRFRRSRKIIWTAAAAVLALMLASSLTLFWLQPNGGEAKEWVTVAVARGQQKDLVLPDGSCVLLAADSKLSYPCDFAQDQRLVKLSGEAFFDVVHKPDQPFKVVTIHSDVRVLGTSFNIKAYPSDPNFSAVLVSGSVEVLMKNEADDVAASCVLKPKQKCLFDIHNKQYKVKTVALDHELAWREKRLSFKNDCFSDIAQELERYYDVDILLKGQELSQRRLTGEFEGEKLETVLANLQEWLPFNYNINNDNILITEK